MLNQLTWQRLLPVILVAVALGLPFGTTGAWAPDRREPSPHVGIQLSADPPGSDDGGAVTSLISVWQTEPIDRAGDVGHFASLAIDSGERVHVAYFDATNGNLKYASEVAGNWDIEIVDSEEEVGVCTSLALDDSDHPHIAYGRNSPQGEDHSAVTTLIAQRYATKTSAGWQLESFDPPPPLAGPYRYECLTSSLALGNDSDPRVGYVRAYWGPPKSTMAINYAERVGAVWQVEELARVGSYTWGDISVAVGSDDRTQAAMAGGHFGSPRELHHGWLQAGTWQWQLLAVHESSFSAVLQLNQTNQAQIAYARYGNALFYAWQVDTRWYSETIAAGDFALTDMALKSDGSPCVVYRSESGDDTLRYACRNGSSWQSEIVTGSGADARFGSLGFRQGDTPVIAFYDATAGDLRLASRELVPATHFAYMPVIVGSNP